VDGEASDVLGRPKTGENDRMGERGKGRKVPTMGKLLARNNTIKVGGRGDRTPQPKDRKNKRPTPGVRGKQLKQQSRGG